MKPRRLKALDNFAVAIATNTELALVDKIGILEYYIEELDCNTSRAFIRDGDNLRYLESLSKMEEANKLLTELKRDKEKKA